MKRVKARKDGVVSAWTAATEASLRDTQNCTVYRGHARFASSREVALGGELLSADRIFIDVGGRAAIPPIPGLDQVTYLTNSSILDLDVVPDHLVVVGGSYVGLEFAQMYRRFGSDVTVIEAGPRLIPREDEEISSAVQQILGIRRGPRVGRRARYACRGRRRRLQPEVRTRFRCGGVGRLASASRCRATTQHGRSRA